MGGGLFILGGALQGYGTGVLESAKAKREAALREVEEQRADRRAQEDRDFRSAEAKIGYNNQAAENEKDRAARINESALDRESNGEYATTDDGGSVFVQGGKAKPVVGEDGKPIKLAGQKGTDKPAEVATAEWLIQQGVAKDPGDAWRMVRLARDDPEKSRASIYKSWLTTLQSTGLGKKSEDIAAEAEKRTEETMRFLDGADTPAGTKAPSKRPAGATDADIAKQAKDAIAGGADKAAVRKRLLEMGVDPAAAGL